MIKGEFLVLNQSVKLPFNQLVKQVVFPVSLTIS